jgi:hypothetical protein
MTAVARKAHCIIRAAIWNAARPVLVSSSRAGTASDVPGREMGRGPLVDGSGARRNPRRACRRRSLGLQMSAEATGYVWKHSPYTGSQLLVHLAIADVVNDTNGYDFWMSTSNLANKARVSRSTVSVVLSDMVKRGHLAVLKAGKTERVPTRYHFLMTSPKSGHVGFPASPNGSESHDRPSGTNLKNETEEPKEAHAREHSKCIRCSGRGFIWNGEGGFDMECPSVTL